MNPSAHPARPWNTLVGPGRKPITVVPLKGHHLARGTPEEQPTPGRPVRGRVKQRGRLRRPECRRAAVPHHMREAGSPAAAGHGAADPAVDWPAVEHRLADQGRPGQDLGWGREGPGRCGPGGRWRNGQRGRTSPPATWSHCVVLGHLLRTVRQLLQPQPLVVRRGVAPSQDQVARHTAHQQAIEQQLHLVLSCPASDTGPGAGGVPARSKKGLRRSTFTVGLQRILRGSARV